MVGDVPGALVHGSLIHGAVQESWGSHTSSRELGDGVRGLTKVMGDLEHPARRRHLCLSGWVKELVLPVALGTQPPAFSW